MNLKEMLNSVLSQSTFTVRQQFAGSSDPDDQQMVAIANRVAEEMRDFYNWGRMRKEHSFVMTSDTQYPLPDDFRNYVADSGWQDKGSRQIELPVPDGRWYMYKNSAFSDGGTFRCRLVGDQYIEVFEPEPGQEIVFYYESAYPVTTQSGIPKPYFTLDTDLFVLDDTTFILGVQAHWAETKLLPQADKWMMNYFRRRNEAVARETGSRTVGGVVSKRNWQSCRSPYTPLWKT